MMIVRKMYYWLPYRVRAHLKVWITRGYRLLFARTPQPREPIARERSEVGTEGLVSVILPTYNGERWLRDAVISVTSQSYAKIELIVVDDGSSDETAGVLRRLQSDGYPIKSVWQAHAGLGAALSLGQRLARGEFCTWTSSDNLMGHDNIALQVEALRRAGDTTVLAYSDYRVIDEMDDPIPRNGFRYMERDRLEPSIVRVPRNAHGLEMGDNFIGCSFLYRMSAQRVIGDYVSELGAEDYDFWLRLRWTGNFLYVPIPDDQLYRYRVHSDSLSAHAQDLQVRSKVDRILVTERRRSEFADDASTGGVARRKSADILYANPALETTEWCFADHKPTEVIKVGIDVGKGGLQAVAYGLANHWTGKFTVVGTEDDRTPDVMINHNGADCDERAPLIEVVHSSYAWLKPWQRNQLAKRLKRADRWVAVSQQVADYTIKWYDADARKAMVIPNGIDLPTAVSLDKRTLRQRHGLLAEAWVWVCTASIFPPKGQLPLVRAFMGRHPPAPEVLLLVGDVLDQNYYSAVLTAAKARQAGENRVDVRVASRTDMAELLACADAFVLPSVVEGWSLALGEALFAGLPIISTAVGAAPELIGQTRHGFLIDPVIDVMDLDYANFDSTVLVHQEVMVERLQAAMDQLRGNESRFATTSLAAQKFMRAHYTLEGCARDYLYALESTIHSQRIPAR